jgi:hypothetical protein
VAYSARVAELGPSGAQVGDLLCIREADEPTALAIVTATYTRSDGTLVVHVVQDPWGPGGPGLEELEAG